jgi:hypothetical protein
MVSDPENDQPLSGVVPLVPHWRIPHARLESGTRVSTHVRHDVADCLPCGGQCPPESGPASYIASDAWIQTLQAIQYVSVFVILME